MKIAVCISCVPDTTSKINFTENNTEFNKEGIQFIINPNDEFGLTRAIWIKEKDNSSIDVINVGLEDSDPILRKTLAIGADKAIRINSNPIDSFQVAKLIADHISKIKIDKISSISSAFHIIKGKGETTVNGKTITWSAKDTFTASVFSQIEHSIEENTFLIHIHDKPLQEKLGYFEERSI